jgi:hypothetical protein
MIDKWRQSMQHGVIYQDLEKDLHLYGGIDDLWINCDWIIEMKNGDKFSFF